MAAYQLRIERIQSGFRNDTGAIIHGISGATEINKMIARNPDVIAVPMNTVSEAQLRGLIQYAACIQGALTTSSVESAITALL